MRGAWAALAGLGCAAPPDAPPAVCEVAGSAVIALGGAGEGGTALFVDDTGGLALVAAATDGLVLARAADPADAAGWGPAEALELVQDGLVGHASGVRLDGVPWLYLASATAASAPPLAWRAQWLGDGFGPIQAVSGLDGLDAYDGAPVFYGDGGAVWAAYTDRDGAPHLAVSPDGGRFVAVDAPGPGPVRAASVSSFGDGVLALVWEGADGAELRRSADGSATWSAPIGVGGLFDPALDPRLLPAAPGSLDAYYVDGEGGVLRRPVASSAAVGPQEEVLPAPGAPLSRPTAHALPGCGVLVTAVDGEDLRLAALPAAASTAELGR